MSAISFTSTLDRVNLADILRRLEAHEKTGMLVVKQSALWVELYFSQGRLMCIGPVRAHLTLGDRLVQAGVISSGALADVMQILRNRGEEASETRIALLLMDMGYTTREQLRSWATREAQKVIEVLLTWRSGEVYFEEERVPPPARLLVSLSPTSLLPVAPAAPVVPAVPAAPLVAPPASGAASVPPQQAQQTGAARTTEEPFPSPAAAPEPLQPRVTQSLPETGAAQGHIDLGSLFEPDALARLSDAAASASAAASPAQMPAQPASPSALPAPTRVSAPYMPRRIDISFMRPDMQLLPADLLPLSSAGVDIPLTPDEWRVFSCVDGHTTLQQAAQRLGMPLEQVAVVTGELIALGLVQAPAGFNPHLALRELSPTSYPVMPPSSGVYGLPQPQPWGQTGALSPLAPAAQQAPVYVETESQWGNGGNGARFVVGRGWGVQPPSTMQAGGSTQMPRSASIPVGGVYPR